MPFSGRAQGPGMALIHEQGLIVSHLQHLLGALMFFSLDSPQNSCILYIYRDLYTKSWPAKIREKQIKWIFQ